MSSLSCIVASALLLTAGAEPLPDAASGPVHATEQAPTPGEETDPEILQGDRITLKSGRELRGVRVLHSTSFKLVLEVLPTVEPLEIPLRQVVRIDYGQHPEPARDTDKQDIDSATDNGPQVLEAVRVSPQLAERLHTPIVDAPLEFLDQDVVNILRSSAILGEIEVSFGPGLDDPERAPGPRLTVTLQAGQTFDAFLRESILPEVPALDVEYRYQSVHFDIEPPAP